MKVLNYLRMNWIVYPSQERLDCIGGNGQKGETTYVASKSSRLVIVVIENEAVIGIAHKLAIVDFIQAIIMKAAFDICMIVQWWGHSCASCSSTLTWQTWRFQFGIPGGNRTYFMNSLGYIEGHSRTARILFKMGLHEAVGGGSPPFSLLSKLLHASDPDSIELVINQSQKRTAVNATTSLHSHSQGTSNAMQRTAYQNVFFVKEIMTCLSDKFALAWRLRIVKLDPRAKFSIPWIYNGIRLISLCRLGFFEFIVTVVEKTGRILMISK